MSNKRTDASRTIAEVLCRVDNAIKLGACPGFWAGDCPLKDQCHHLDKPGKSSRWAPFLGAALLCALGLGGGVVISHTSAPVPIDTLSNGAVIYREQHTGDVFGTDADPTAAFEATITAGLPVVEVSRWSTGEEWVYFVTCFDQVDSLFVSRDASPEWNNPGKLLTSVMKRCAATLLHDVENEVAQLVGSEEIEIDGIPVRFNKWMSSDPGCHELEYWQGAVISR